ncbi:MAG: histidine kinase [Ignavibacteriales bacterium]|nr:histidine kinase [Ignavibacteriales bacterium]MCB9219060.1 histidine kinase [Ignavibacteriales bacterium]MCB9259641.1 histidine kinase [Ignavibacteriales bacterium]
MINPFVKNIKSFSVYLISWIFIFLLHTNILYFVLNLSLTECIIDSFVFNLTFLVLGLSFWYSTKFISFEIYSTVKIITNHFTAAFFTSGIWVFLDYWILSNIFNNNNEYLNFLYDSLVWRFFIGMMYYFIIVALIYIIIYYGNFQEKVLKESELKSLVKEAELKSLKYQINPHFIFNSLNSISALTLTEPDLARKMTIDLSTFLRKTLSSNEIQKSKLIDELNNAKLYLDIEKIRFGDKFIYSEELSDACMTIEVPTMILQPIFENAIKHGVYESLEPVNINFKCEELDEYMKLTITNNYDDEAVPHKGEGIGITNIQSRLRMIYNQDNLLKFSKNNGIFTVTIFIPVQ